jgi:hypothetical protein
MTQKNIEKTNILQFDFYSILKFTIFVIEFLDPELDPDPQCGSTNRKTSSKNILA